MAYTDTNRSYGETTAAYEGQGNLGRKSYGAGVTAFLWVAWALVAAFWAASFSTAIGIFKAITSPTPAVAGTAGIDAGGAGRLLIDVVGGIIVLGIAIGWGMARYMSRDRRVDPVTEASTAALYDAVERQGGEDMTTRSPEARHAVERDAYRDSQRANPGYEG